MTEYHYPIIYLDTTESTNLFAQDLLRKFNATHGMVVFAEHQLQGRGQRGNQWFSEKGLNLTFSMILFPEILHVNRHFELNEVFSLGIYDFLSAKGIKHINIKWPNDILVGGKKAAGILLENTIRGETIHTVIGGVGINVNQDVFNGKYNVEPTSLKLILQQTTSLKEALNDVLCCIWKRYQQMTENNTSLKKSYDSVLFKLNQTCRFKTDHSTFDGVLRGIADDGQLLIENENGVIKSYSTNSMSMIVK